MTVVGAVFLPQLAPERLQPVARAADAAGLEELWLWEDCFRESGIASAAAALAWTSRIRVGIGLLPVPLRNVAITAMEAATLERLFPGRVLVGVGHGVQDWMRQVGAQARSPVTLLREHLVALRALLDGETVSTSGTSVQLDGVRLDWPPPVGMTLHAGAQGPRTLALVGELADGTVLPGGTTPGGVRQARAVVDAAGRAAGRTGSHRITVYVLAATGDRADTRLRRSQEQWGMDAAADTGLAGDAATVAAGVRRWSAAGADAVVLQPTDDDPDPESFMAFAAEVGRLVR